MSTPIEFIVFTCFAAVTIHAAENGVAKVVQVIDGDTCLLEDGQRVRYLGMNAPEKGDAHAEEATQANNKLVGGREVRLEFGRNRTDRDGRLLAYVFAGKTFINEELVREGHAHVLRPVTAKYKDRLFQAQEEARIAGRGIWGNAADRKLAITSVHAKPEKGGKENLRDEYVVIENRGDKPVDMTGWTISDETNHRYLVPNYMLAPKSQVTLRTGLGKNTEKDLFWGSRAPIWNDNGDSIFIKDADGNLVLVHIY